MVVESLALVVFSGLGPGGLTGARGSETIARVDGAAADWGRKKGVFRHGPDAGASGVVKRAARCLGVSRGLAQCALLLVLWVPLPTRAQSTDVVVPAPPSPSVSDFERLQREHAGEIDFCLARERSLHPGAAGVLVVELTLDPEGHALTAVTSTSTFTGVPTVVGECVRAAVLRWTYPPPNELDRVHTLTFVLGMAPIVEPVPDAVGPATPRVRRSTYWVVHSYDYGSDPIADEVRAGLGRYREQLIACFADEAAGVPGEIVLEIAVPGGGDIVRDGLTIVSSPYDSGPRLLRCLSPYVSRIEARSAREPRRVRWWVWVP